MARSRASKPETMDPRPTDDESVDDEIAAEDLEGDESASKVTADSAGSKSMSKAKAARYAIEQGYESPQEAVAFILDELGIDMAPQHFSAVKSQLRKKERVSDDATGQTAPRRGRPPAISSLIANSTRRPAAGGDDEMDLLDAMEAIKPLVESMGAERVKRIVDLLG